MEYKEKYEKAYKLLEQIHDGGIVSKIDIENTFPELKKKSVINMLKIAIKNTAWLDCDKNKCLSWLEKQSEQNSTDSYCKDNCKGFQETGKCFADGECKAKREAEQKSTQEIEPFEVEHGKYYYCIKDYFSGGRKQASKGDVVQALRGLPIMGLKDANEYFLPVNNIYSTR